MFRPMRRAKQLLSMKDTHAVLLKCTNGILACMGDGGYPYAVPLSYVYFQNKIYFHCAKMGHKTDAIAQNPKVSFAVVEEDTIVSAQYTSFFRSVIVFGKARVVEGQEWTDAFAALVEKYSGDQPEAAKREAVAGCGDSLVVAIDIEHLTGKEAIEYASGRVSRRPV